MPAKAFASGLAIAAILLSGNAGAVSWAESVNGDLSNNGLAPTALALTNGSNPVDGAFGSSGTPEVFDRDYIAVTVPAGFRLKRLKLVSLQAGGAVSFIGMQAGPQVTMPPTSFDPSPLFGWTHFVASQAGTDLLAAMGITPPLAAGAYSVWLQETDDTQSWPYAVDFELEPVPSVTAKKVPALGLASLLLMAFACLGVEAYRRQRATVRHR
jgi:hypothetical protein